MKVITDAADTDKTNKDIASAKDTASATLKTMNESAVTNAQKQCTDTDTAIAAKNSEILRLKNNIVIAKHVYELTKDKFDNL